MFAKLFATRSEGVLTWIRLCLGIVMLAHGAQKVLGWFGGAGFSGTMSFFEGMGIPAFFAFLAILAEFGGGIALILGFLTRIAAFGIVVEMLVAVLLVHAKNGFFMNWAGTKPGEGFEYHILLFGLGVAVLVRGAGAFSIDGWIGRALERSRQAPTGASPGKLRSVG